MPGGVRNRRPFGTVIAGKSVEVKNAEFRRRRTRSSENRPNSAAIFCVDVLREGEVFCRFLGHYGLMLDDMDGRRALILLYRELDDLIKEHGDKKLIVAGDFNL